MFEFDNDTFADEPSRRRWVAPLLALILVAGAAAGEGSGGSAGDERAVRLRAEAAALLAPIREAGGYQAVAERLAPWRERVAARIAAVPEAQRGGGYVAGDLPIDGGDGMLLSGQRAKQLLYESDFSGTDAVGERRYRRAEAMLLRHHRELAELGVRLVVVVAPDKCDVFPERIAPVPAEVPTVHLQSRRLFARLLHAGVEVVYPEDELRARRGGEAGPLYMLRDTHWSPAGSRFAAGVVAERLAAYRRENADLIERPDQVHRWDGDLAENWYRAGYRRCPKEEHRFVGVARRNGKPLRPSAESPVLVVGDSYSTYPYNGYFAFWAFLAQRLGRPVGFADRAGGGNAVLDRFRRLSPARREVLEVVVLLFTSCSLYEVDFAEIPLLDAPLPPPPLVEASVVVQEDCPAVDPRRADYDDALANLRVLVDRGDGLAVPMQLHVPILQDRRLLPAANWRRGEHVVLDLHPEAPAGQAGVMVLSGEADPALPAVYVHRPGFPGEGE